MAGDTHGRTLASWTYWLLCVLGTLVQGLLAHPLAQNPFETIGLGAMTIASNAQDLIASGAALRKEHDIDTPLFSLHSKAEVGYGDAMRPRADSDEDSDERRRRRRRRRRAVGKAPSSQLAAKAGALPKVPLAGGALRRHYRRQQRRKRSPCFNMGAGSGGGTGDSMDYSEMEEIRRRLRRAQQKRKAAQKKRSTANSGKTSKTSSGKKSAAVSRRRRRQTEQEDLAGDEAATLTKSFADHARNFADKMNSFFGAIYSSMKETMQRVQQTFRTQESEAQ